MAEGTVSGAIFSGGWAKQRDDVSMCSDIQPTHPQRAGFFARKIGREAPGRE